MNQLPQPWKKIYQTTRIILILFFLLSAFFLAHRILLPSQSFRFIFSDIESRKNTLKNLRRENGNIILNASSIIDFSKVNAIFKNENFKEAEDDIGWFSVQKSYQAFFYPQGEDLTIPLSESGLNPNNGRLVSSQESVYILQGNQKLPIDNPVTFEALGYAWPAVTPFNDEELFNYERESLINIHAVHPNGTIFHTTDTDKYFYISNGEKREIKGSKEIIQSYLENKSPISVIESALTDIQKCQLRDDLIFQQYDCEVSLENLVNYPGKDYRVILTLSTTQTNPKNIHVSFGEKITWNNIRHSLSVIKNKIIQKYSAKK